MLTLENGRYREKTIYFTIELKKSEYKTLKPYKAIQKRMVRYCRIKHFLIQSQIIFMYMYF